MKNNVMTDFSVDKENNTVNVKKTFEAPQNHVWAAWTEPELLDRWWAPKPWKSETKTMDFKEGGRRLYAMVGPEGEEHWALADYKSINPKTNFTFLDGFCDSEGNLNHDLPRSNWSVNFSESNGTTSVHVEISYEKLSDLEQTVEMGFKEGFIAALENLDEVLPAIEKDSGQ